MSVRQCLSIFSYILFSSNLSYANTIKIDSEHMSRKKIEEIIIYDSSILDAFWSGDDGVDCGEPSAELLFIDYVDYKIHLNISPAAQAYTCELKSVVCELSFTEGTEGSILILDQSVALYGDKCSL